MTTPQTHLPPDETVVGDLPAVAGNQLGKNVATTRGRDGRVMVSEDTLGAMVEFAQLMAKSAHMIPPQFRGNPGACLGIVSQARRWGMEPFGLASASYVTRSKDGSERIAYEAKAITAVINSNAPLVGVLEYDFDGAGNSRRCTVTGMLRGAKKPSTYTTPTIGTVNVKNSPLWSSDPDQQLAYYASRAWARRYCPQTLLGVVTVDEVGLFEDGLLDVTPAPNVAAHLTAQVMDGETPPQAPQTAREGQEKAGAQPTTPGEEASGEAANPPVDAPLVFPVGDLFEEEGEKEPAKA